MAAVVGGYRLITRLRSGGMAEVYLAENRARRQVAVKRTLPNLMADPRFAFALRDEAIIGARLRHPHVVRVLDYECDAGREHLVMELVDGATLAQLAPQQLPLSACASLIAQAALALDYVHGMGIVHGDVTPSNLLVAAGDMPGVAHLKLCDFGLSYDLRVPALRPLSGNPAYLAPELSNASLGDRRSDLYSLSACAWELLAASRLHPQHAADDAPWPRPVDERKPRPDFTLARRAAIPPLPHSRRVSAIEQVIRHGLQSDPAARMSSARELAEVCLDWLRTQRQVGSPGSNAWWEALAQTPPAPISSTEITITAVG